MTLNISQLRDRVKAAHFSDVEQVDDSIIRFTRKAGKLPFAVYYFDVAQDLPETQETLTKYQDRVIGKHYFEGKKSLQWSNYLYFVTSRKRLAGEEVLQAKELIERDRSYARKFVISEEELETVLQPRAVEITAEAPQANILSVWVDQLTDAGLARAILSDDDLPTRMKLIEYSTSKPAARRQVPRRRTQVRTEPFIRSLELKTFRNFPVQRRFNFGTVNLIYGVNGSGKTSLLEAIELLYCGRNKRNPESRPPYELDAVFADGTHEVVTESRRTQLFRDRNLIWYGQSEIKTNNLYQSFAQFNFLDTDAAVSLSDSTSLIEEDLSKLLIGPDASKTWRDIERVNDAVVAKLRGLRPLEGQINEEITNLKKRIEAANGVQQESDSIRTRLEEMLSRVGWRVAHSDKREFAGRLVESLAELLPVAVQSAGLDWTESPVSIESMTKYCREVKNIIEKVEPHIGSLDTLRKNQKRFADKVKRGQEAKNIANQAIRLIDAGVLNRAAERSKQKGVIANLSNWLAGLDEDALMTLSTENIGMKVATCHKTAVSKRFDAEVLLTSKKNEYRAFSKLRDESLNLAQELRQVAIRILKSSPTPDECPLCHTQFKQGELIIHINVGINEPIDAAGQTLLNQLQELEGVVRDVTAVEAASDWLKKFCERATLAADISVQAALTEVQNAKRKLVDARVRLQELSKEERALESQGLSVTRLEEILAQLREMGYHLTESSREVVDQLVANIEQDCANSSRALEEERRRVDALQQIIDANLSLAVSDVKEVKSALSQLQGRLATTESLYSKLDAFSPSFPWPMKKPLAKLVVETESVSKVAVELQAALARERQVKDTYTESIKRKEHLEGKLTELRPRMKRLIEAHSTLESLQNEHSLKRAMETALQQNRASIETIFSVIHSPAEFRGLGSSWTALVRKVDGSEAKLSEISTGQRAAFALSIFLSQNAQVMLAPPVVLIDDPIAHIDDLNALSFLDYLREIALTGRRQIFFATASDKIATLFERKFDFLGSDRFHRFNLTRESYLIEANM